MFFRYRKYLEQQIIELKEEKKALEVKQDELIRALVPVLRRIGEPAVSISPKKEKTHEIVRAPGGAKCACGWHVVSNDPADLQTLIDNHYRENVRPVLAGRKSWLQARTQLEQEAEKENMEETA